MKLIGIICLGFCMAYYHPCEKPVDWVFMILFWVGLNFFVDGSED